MVKQQKNNAIMFLAIIGLIVIGTMAYTHYQNENKK
jgi:hypothetical protein